MEKAGLFCGVDVGASATKLVLVNHAKAVLARVVRLSGVDYEATARECLEAAKSEAGVSEEVTRTVSTGYGRRNVPFADASITEIHCHGIGSYHHFPRAITIVDIGGQDNKVIHLDEKGQRDKFLMNRKCAAGTGAFIEEIALRLGIALEKMNGLAESTTEIENLNSFCTVFAKTEILAMLRRGVPAERIVRGAFLSVVNRVVEMDPLDGEIVLTGGVVAHNPVVAEVMSKKLNRSVNVPPDPQFTGAFGAALIAINQSVNE